jgi:hypothetical protein
MAGDRARVPPLDDLLPTIRQVLARKSAALVGKSSTAMLALIDPDFLYVNAAGEVYDRTGYVSEYCANPDLVFLGQDVMELTVRGSPECATAAMTLQDEFRYRGALTRKTYRSFAVFRRVAGEWRWAGGQTGSIELSEGAHHKS